MKKFVGIQDIARNDPYKIRQYNKDSFDYIIDIGANVGQFAITSYILFPSSKIVCYEPCTETYTILCDNLEGIPNTILNNQAVGNGDLLYFKPSGSRSKTCTGNLFKEYKTGGYAVSSITIDSIFQYNNISPDTNILMKIDCEGGEQYILKDEYRNILRSCKHLSIEVHFQCSGTSKNSSNFVDLPKWDDYNDWIQNTFRRTHNILYHKSSKRLGLGVYVITRQ